MKFEEAVRHIQEGTATEEEKAFVQGVLDPNGEHQQKTPRVIEKPKPARVKGQKREIGKFYQLVIAIVVVVIALGAIFAGVFGSATVQANKADTIDRAQAAEIATNYAFALTQDASMKLPLVNEIGDLSLLDTDRDFEYVASKPSASYYVYEVRLEAVGVEITVCVDSRDRSCKLDEIKHM